MSNSTKTITITEDSHEAEEFKTWLESKGYNVEYGIESAVDGYPCSDMGNIQANELHNKLWEQYCNG